MPEEELQNHTSISPEYALELRIKELEERMRRVEEQQLNKSMDMVNEVEKQLARRWRIVASTFGRDR